MKEVYEISVRELADAERLGVAPQPLAARKA